MHVATRVGDEDDARTIEAGRSLIAHNHARRYRPGVTETECGGAIATKLRRLQQRVNKRWIGGR